MEYYYTLTNGKWIKRDLCEATTSIHKPISPKKTKNTKKKKPHKYPNLKQKELVWFITDEGKKVIPSPIEDRIRTILNGYEYEFHTEVSFKGLNPTGSKRGYLRFDYYIPGKKIAIEYQGKGYHSSPDRKERDKLKVIFCKVNGIKLYRYKAKDLSTIDKQIHMALLG